MTNLFPSVVWTCYLKARIRWKLVRVIQLLRRNDSSGDEQNDVLTSVSSSDAFRRKFCSQDRTRDKGTKIGWVEPRLYELQVTKERLLSSSTHAFDSGREWAGLRVSQPVYCCVSDLTWRPDIHKSLRAIPLIAGQKLIRVSCLIQKLIRNLQRKSIKIDFS